MPFFPVAGVVSGPFRWEDGMLVALAFLLGGVVGSFLNVVAHRVPRGRSVVTGRSACPACGRRIRARDNLPVLGWLLLRGRCRDCGAAIAPRYALVEAACGFLLAGLAGGELVEWRAAGGDTPLLERLLMEGDAAWLARWGAKSIAMLALVARSLLALEGHSAAPRTSALTALVAAALAAAAAPVPFDGAVGAAVGAAVGWLIAAGLGTATDRWGLPVVGAAGGWQAAIATAAVAAAIRVIRRAAGDVRGSRDGPGGHRGAFDALAASAAVWIAWPLLEPAVSPVAELLTKR